MSVPRQGDWGLSVGRRGNVEVEISSMSMRHLDRPAVRRYRYIRIGSRPVDIWAVVSAGAWKLIIAISTVNIFGEQKLFEPLIEG